MTPFQFDILLHYYVSPEPHRVALENPPIWPETLAWFLRENLLKEWESPHRNKSYTTTPRGAAYIEHVLATPLPVAKWVIPESAEE